MWQMNTVAMWGGSTARRPPRTVLRAPGLTGTAPGTESFTCWDVACGARETQAGASLAPAVPIVSWPLGCPSAQAPPSPPLPTGSPAEGGLLVTTHHGPTATSKATTAKTVAATAIWLCCAGFDCLSGAHLGPQAEGLQGSFSFSKSDCWPSCRYLGWSPCPPGCTPSRLSPALYLSPHTF